MAAEQEKIEKNPDRNANFSLALLLARGETSTPPPPLDYAGPSSGTPETYPTNGAPGRPIRLLTRDNYTINTRHVDTTPEYNQSYASIAYNLFPPCDDGVSPGNGHSPVPNVSGPIELAPHFINSNKFSSGKNMLESPRNIDAVGVGTAGKPWASSVRPAPGIVEKLFANDGPASAEGNMKSKADDLEVAGASSRLKASDCSWIAGGGA